jgi:YbgC/YbaW family acyl-CoA thioester hydrolase
MSITFEYQRMILEKDLDSYGHVNNAVYMDLYEEARWEFITQNGWGLDRVHRDQLGPVILEAHIQYKKELKNREKIRIISVFKEMRNPLVMIIDQQILNDAGQIVSTMELHMGLMDLARRRLIRPPEEWMQAIGAR